MGIHEVLCDIEADLERIATALETLMKLIEKEAEG